MKRLTACILFLFFSALFAVQLPAQKPDKKHFAFSGMTNEQAVEVQNAASDFYNLPVNTTIRINDTSSIELVLIPPGTFLMGSKYPQEKRVELLGGKIAETDLERPQHTVTITKPFYISRYEITQSNWTAIMDNNPSPVKSPALPVGDISWDLCKEFCSRLSEKSGKDIRLPTEAEWDYSCRAGTTTGFSSEIP